MNSRTLVVIASVTIAVLTPGKVHASAPPALDAAGRPRSGPSYSSITGGSRLLVHTNNANVLYSKGDVFAGVGNGLVAHYNNQGGLLEYLNTGSGSAEMTGMGFDLDGNLYVTEFEGNGMAKFDNAGKLLQQPWGGPFNLHPESITFDDNQNLYVGQADGTGQVLKFDRQGTLLSTYAPAREDRGTDWITLSTDGCTLFYTSEGQYVHRFDVCANSQLPDFAVLPTSAAYALRIRPNGEVIVAATSAVHRLNATGQVMQSYQAATYGENFFFALNLDPDNETFWTAGISSGNIYRIRISDGALVTSFNAPHTNSVAGLTILGEIATPNHPPVCNAGGPYTATCQGTTTTIRLDGTGSSDSDPGDVLSYHWTSDCPGATYDDPTSATPNLTLDTSSGADVACHVSLTVIDGHPNGSSTCSGSVQISACPIAPVCDAGPAQSGTVCQPLSFVGSRSHDPAGGPLTFTWDFGDGRTAAGLALNTVTHVYDPDTPEGEQHVKLTVTNSHGRSSSCEVLVSLSAPQQTITGLIHSLGGGVIAGASLSQYQAGGAFQGTALSRSDGSYEIPLRPGWDYAVHCEADGYYPQTATGLTVCAGDNGRRVNFTLIPIPPSHDIVAVDHTGLSPGDATHVTLTIRPQQTGAYFIKLSLDDRFSLQLAPGPASAGLVVSTAAPSVATSRVPGAFATIPDDSPTNAPAGGSSCCLRDHCYYITGLNLTGRHIYGLPFLIQDSGTGPTSNVQWADIELFTSDSKPSAICPSVPSGKEQDKQQLPLVVDRPSGLDAARARQLLEQYQPIFVLDSQETSSPQDVDVLLDRAAIRQDEAYLNGLVGIECNSEVGCANRGMTAALLTRGTSHVPYLDLYGDGAIAPTPPRTTPWQPYATGTYGHIVYGTALRVGEKLFLTYLCFFNYENAIAGLPHEGDWERVVILLESAGELWKPIQIVYHNHCDAQGIVTLRQWDSADLVAVNGRMVPRVYVSREYHGMYPHVLATAPCDPLGATDFSDGRGLNVKPWDAARPAGAVDPTTAYARLEVIPRFDKIGPFHPARWALFPGAFGNNSLMQPADIETLQPRSPLLNDGAWTIPDDSEYPKVELVGGTASPRDTSGGAIRQPGQTAVIPVVVYLAQPRPTPFEGTTVIEYGLPKVVRVRVDVFDVGGRRVRQLVDAIQGPGRKSVVWDGTSDRNGRVGAGIYIIRLAAGDVVRHIRAVRL